MQTFCLLLLYTGDEYRHSECLQSGIAVRAAISGLNLRGRPTAAQHIQFAIRAHAEKGAQERANKRADQCEVVPGMSWNEPKNLAMRCRFDPLGSTAVSM